MDGQSRNTAFDGRRALWRGIGCVLAPLVRIWLWRRVAKGKEDAARLGERLGRAAKPRPAGLLVWSHGASVGEAQALLPLLRHLHAVRPDITLLLTTGTVTSAALVQQRAETGILHQFVPVDLPGAIDGFLDHWRPDLVVWSESDFWPGILSELRRRNIPALLVNARLSERSVRRWMTAPATARWLLDAFAAIYAQTAGDAERLRRLGARDVTEAGNLKQAAPPLPANEAALAEWRRLLVGRPLWLAASTHPGEEMQIAAAHHLLKPQLPGLLTMIVPRHPDRGAALRQELASGGDLRIALRSAGEQPDADTDLYIADTLGELGLWYRLCPVVMMGGSLVPVGGHNPLEPARLGAAVLFGPQMFNFSEAVSGLLSAGALQVQDAPRIANAVAGLLQSPQRRSEVAEAGRRFASADDAVIERLASAVLERLPARQA